jgi:hypothetical protein
MPVMASPSASPRSRSSVGLVAFVSLGCLAVAVGGVVGAGCGASASASEGILGSYSVGISKDGLTDPDVMTIDTGANGTLLLMFATGIRSAADGPSPLGIRAKLDGTKLTAEDQPAEITHATGVATGRLRATGTLAPDGSSVQLTISFAPTSFSGRVDLGTTATDGGFPTLTYELTGSKL